ncbi:beta-ketoacyl synthase [Nostoc sp. NIES-4103]|nr:beta-ketoacyl synthase [Nostoc sp. NIES-4103]
MDNLESHEALEGIAIVGLAGRFPGAKNVEEFWQNIKNGVESISFFSEQELASNGIDSEVFRNPNYVKAKAVLDDIDLFDAAFFGFSPKEATITDPQHRIFLESAWSALENAGYNPETYTGAIGVYAGVGMSGYLLNHLFNNSELTRSAGTYQMIIANDKDFLPTRVSYKLNLKGPSINIQTACSTSLVATCMACQSLLNYQCDMALAGGVSISLPQKTGYFYQEGMIFSPDGHCRAFDTQAQGTLAGSGVGIVVLKRLEDAIADGDTIHAVIKGFALNNDGSMKVGYTAPSVDGQAEVIAQALAMAEVDPETVSYIEAHGTGTPLGDPIEIAALTKAFRANTQKKNFCAIGSVKTNIGHLDVAAGVTGLIKTVQALKHQSLPPSLHFETPNPKIDFANSPFYVNTKLIEWQKHGSPRRAGVSSFGIGGTNAHVVLEEAPVGKQGGLGAPSGDRGERGAGGRGRSYQLLLVSAKSESALNTATYNLIEHFKRNSELNLADVAYTLAVGRKGFNHRRIVVCNDSQEAVTALSQLDKRVLTNTQASQQPTITFMFSGQGSQYVNMALELYQVEPIFREQIDKCSEFLKLYLGLDLRDVLYPNKEPDFSRDLENPSPNLSPARREALISPPSLLGKEAGGLGFALAFPHDVKSQNKEQIESATQQLKQTAITQPALFVIEYALAQLLMSWGVRPQAAIGHSIGEYVAACIAGVFSLEDALSLVAARGRLMQQMPAGAMLAVSLTETEARSHLNENLSLAVINSPASCVIAGTIAAIDALEQQLLTQGVESRRLHTSHGFHSQMMEPILEPFIQLVRKVRLNSPKIPYISNVTGTWITAQEATDPNYWALHLRQTVRFADGVEKLMQDSHRILLEVGPGRTLTTLAKQHPYKDATLILSSLRHPQEQQSDVAFLLNTLGRLWLTGVEIDWSKFYTGEQHYRVPLPTYPFERQRYWVEPQALSEQQQQVTNSWLWKAGVEAGEKQALADISKFIHPTYLAKQQCLDHLCVANLNLILKDLGAFSQPNDKYSVEDLLEQFLILPQHKQLLSQWLQILVEQGQLQQEGEVFSNLLPISHEAFEALVAEVKLKWADTPLWADPILLAREKLPSLLTGKENSLNLLFTQDSLAHTERIALDWPMLSYYNAIAKTILQQIIKSLPSQVKLRVLDIGAGMGLTTADLLPVLPPQQTTYVYTDVARLFLDNAKQKFSNYPFIEYKLLDIERSPQEQGYDLHSFDVIVAANVLHVTQNIKESLDHVRSLLAPGGLLLIWEVTQPQLIYNVTDGLWMKPLQDGERTQANPFLSQEQWQKALLTHGFVEAEIIPKNNDFGYHIFLAQAPVSDAAPLAFTQKNESKEADISLKKKSDIADWFYIPSWQRSLIPVQNANPNTNLPRKIATKNKEHSEITSPPSPSSPSSPSSPWLVFLDECGLGDRIVNKLEFAGEDVITVSIGEHFSSNDQNAYTLNPSQRQDYETLWQELQKRNQLPQKIAHLWSVTPEEFLETRFERVEKLQNLGLWSLLFLAQALGKHNFSKHLQIAVISNNLQEVTGEENLCPEKATLLGPCKVIPQEYLNISCRSIDIILPEFGSQQREKLISNLLTELTLEASDMAIAYRGNHRWVQTFAPIRLDRTEKTTPKLRNGGVYLITGGLGGIGLVLAEYLAKTVQAKLVLLGRSHFPAKSEWEQWLLTHDEQDSVSVKIRQLQAMEALGAEIAIAIADVANLEQMQVVIDQVSDRFGKIHGVIHAAGVIPGGMIQLKTAENISNLLAPKVIGTLVLDTLLQDFELDFFVLCSSLNSFLAGLGLVDHCAANSFLDAFANYKASRSNTLITSINWDGWQEVGQAAKVKVSEQLQQWREVSFQQGILSQEGVEVFDYILNSRLPQVLVSTQDFIMRFEQFSAAKELQNLQSHQQANSPKPNHSRPKLSQAYVAPRSQLEQTITQIWQQSLGIEPVGINDDFFELGGDSLLAVHLIAKISEATQTKLSPHSLMDAPTIADLAELITQNASLSQLTNEHTKPELPSTLVEMQPLGSKPPLFLIHPIGGHVYIYRDLAQYLNSDQPVYGLQAQGIDGKTTPLTQVEQMATHYIEALRVVQPEGPYFLGGSSFGGTIAYEMAQQLQAQGEKVALLALIDTPGIGHMPSENIEDDEIEIMSYALGVGANVPVATEHLQQLSTEEQLQYFLEQGKTALRMPADFSLTELRVYYNLFKINIKAMRNYVPQAYAGRVIFFKASDRDAFNPQNPELGWQDLALAGLKIHQVPGNHITMNFPPHVQVMAKWLTVYLESN